MKHKLPLSCTCPELLQSSPHRNAFHSVSILILSSHTGPYFPNGVFHLRTQPRFLNERLVPPMPKPTTTGRDPWLQFCNTGKLQEVLMRCFNLVQNSNLQESNKPSFSFSLNNNIHVA